MTPAAQQDEDTRTAARRERGPADTWIDMDLNDRCMLWSVGPPMLPTGYNNNYVILQTPDHVVIHVEMIHDTRIIPLDGRPRPGRPIPQWLGEMRGHWEGDTLVVETRRIARSEEGSSHGNDVVRIRAANGGRTESLRVIERFTRVDADTIRYQFTVEDPVPVDEPVVRRSPVASDRRAALRVRLPRGELQHRQRAERRARRRPRRRSIVARKALRATSPSLPVKNINYCK